MLRFFHTGALNVTFTPRDIRTSVPAPTIRLMLLSCEQDRIMWSS